MDNGKDSNVEGDGVTTTNDQLYCIIDALVLIDIDDATIYFDLEC